MKRAFIATIIGVKSLTAPHSLCDHFFRFFSFFFSKTYSPSLIVVVAAQSSVHTPHHVLSSSFIFIYISYSFFVGVMSVATGAKFSRLILSMVNSASLEGMGMKKLPCNGM